MDDELDYWRDRAHATEADLAIAEAENEQMLATIREQHEVIEQLRAAVRGLMDENKALRPDPLTPPKLGQTVMIVDRQALVIWNGSQWEEIEVTGDLDFSSATSAMTAAEFDARTAPREPQTAITAQWRGPAADYWADPAGINHTLAQGFSKMVRDAQNRPETAEIIPLQRKAANELEIDSTEGPSHPVTGQAGDPYPLWVRAVAGLLGHPLARDDEGPESGEAPSAQPQDVEEDPDA